MSRRPARVVQSEINRAIRAVKQAGARMVIEIRPDGTIRLVPVEFDPKDVIPSHDLEYDRDIVL